jgi:TatD DNase family protein
MEPFRDDREEVIRRAQEAGLEAVISIGSDFKGSEGAVGLARTHAFVYASVGIHPHDAKDFNDEVLEQLRVWAQDEKVVAIGETGLDFHYDLSPRDVQKAVFIRQLQLAKELDMPVIVHSREAKEETLEIIEESGVRKGVLHCFSGDLDMAERAMALGFHISFAGPVTFKNADSLREIAKVIPDDLLLIETDAPYLTPVPFRGKRNEPAYVVHTARLLAEIRGVSVEDIGRITTVNAKRLFGIGAVSQGAIAYKIRESLYLNITNRCTSKCIFCIRYTTDFVKGHNLRLEKEPSAEELIEAIGDPTQYQEVVFCGYGEPTLRLDVIKSVSRWVKEKGGKVRINTNGHGNLIHKRPILPELEGLVDSLSISLDAQDEETYNRICRPAFPQAFEAVKEFISEAKRYVPHVQATVVAMEGVDIPKCQAIADELGVSLRVRGLDVVG